MCSLSGVPAFHCFPRSHSCTGFCRDGLPTRSLAALKLPAQGFPSSRRPGGGKAPGVSSCCSTLLARAHAQRLPARLELHDAAV
eukprot:5226852-Prymnesium_polylepis.1